MMSWRPFRGLMLAAALLFVASCGADGPTSPSSNSPAVPATSVPMNASLIGGLTGGLLNGLLACSPQPYASTTQVVGPAG
ncbi:MAG TPA: hypothetical protein VMJ30_05010, partial [Gemmatimonadales bacterium]|nr:hypothetical protein [Gemmatimonadales bacterium]